MCACRSHDCPLVGRGLGRDSGGRLASSLSAVAGFTRVKSDVCVVTFVGSAMGLPMVRGTRDGTRGFYGCNRGEGIPETPEMPAFFGFI